MRIFHGKVKGNNNPEPLHSLSRQTTGVRQHVSYFAGRSFLPHRVALFQSGSAMRYMPGVYVLNRGDMSFICFSYFHRYNSLLDKSISLLHWKHVRQSEMLITAISKYCIRIVVTSFIKLSLQKWRSRRGLTGFIQCLHSAYLRQSVTSIFCSYSGTLFLTGEIGKIQKMLWPACFLSSMDPATYSRIYLHNHLRWKMDC